MLRNAERFERELLTTEAQLEVLRDLNDRCWGGELDEAQFQAIDVDDQPQTLDNARVIHAEFADPIDTIDHWRRVYMNTGWGERHWNSLPRTKYLGEYLRPLDPSKGRIATYAPGIHLVHMDLTKSHTSFDYDAERNFRPVRDLDEVRAQVSGIPMLLAHSEVLSLVGLHKAFRGDDGYATGASPHLSGYEMKNVYAGRPGEAYDWVPVMDSSGKEGEIGLRCRPAKDNLYGAIPLVYPQD
jgi:hypothetical protein